MHVGTRFGIAAFIGVLSLGGAAAQEYEFKGGYPTPETVQKAYDDADFTRAVEAYKFFYPGVAFAAGFFSLETVGIHPNRGAGVMLGSPKQIIFTPNSDTPYAFGCCHVN
jgi:hypothetical protein